MNVYARGLDWHGEREPVHSVEVIDDEAFARGRRNIEEGGPKGLAIDKPASWSRSRARNSRWRFHALRSITGAG